jgi:hypothetical protein
LPRGYLSGKQPNLNMRRLEFMKLKITTAIPAMALMLCAAGTMSAQDLGPPKVLVINREYTKPGKGGELHEKSESAFVAAAKANKAPFHYLGMTSVTGPDRALFFSGYDSFASWAAENKEIDKIPALGSALDHAMVGDGDLLSETDTSVWMRDDEMSLNPGNLVGMRYMELRLFKIKSGHSAEWSEAVKMVKDAYKKGVPEANWVMFEEMYGSPGGGFLVIEPLKSIGEIDAHMASGPKFAAALGKDGMKKLDSLMAASIEEEQTNLFHFDPKMSLPWPELIAGEPDYWTPKHAAAPAKKPAASEKK